MRARVTYSSVMEGDRGTYQQETYRTQSPRFSWEGLGGSTCSVQWYMVEILPPFDMEDCDSNTAGIPCMLIVCKQYLNKLDWAERIEYSQFAHMHDIGLFVCYTQN